MAGQAMDRGRGGGHSRNAGGKARLEWVDAAKGLGIILVVIAHVWTQGRVRDSIYAFHMPLFFLLAGYVARPHSVADFLRKQWAATVVPYGAFLVALMAFDPGIESLRGHAPMFLHWGDAVRAMLLGGTELRGPFTIFWFVPCLFFARFAQTVLMRFWPNPRDRRWGVAMACVAAFGVWVGTQTDFSPLGLLSVPVALVFLWLGALWRTVPGDGWWVAAAALAGAALLSVGTPVPLNMKIADYGVPGWSLVLALLLSVGLAGVARLVSMPASQALGRMSMVIMYLHVAVVHYVTPYAGRPVRFALALGVSVAAWFLLSRTGWGRRYFLGQRIR